MKKEAISLGFLVLAGPVLMADPPVTTQAKPADLLTEALPILRDNYPGFANLNAKADDQLKDLVARSAGGIRLLASPGKPTPIMPTLLPGNIGYWRLASFSPEKTWDDLSAQLEKWTSQDFQGMILDLRSNAGPDDLDAYSGAAQVASFFSRDGTLPFSLSGTTSAIPVVSFHPEQPYRGPMVVVINHETGSAGEALAGYLKSQGALVIGERSGGNGYVFQEKVLGAGQVLSYEVMTVVLSDGTQLAKHPVIPDLSPKIDAQAERGALILIKDNHLLDVIQESPERHLMSEASLVNGDDPEWNAFVASLEKKGDDHYMTLPPIRDTVLIEAIDSLKAIRLSQRPLLPDPKNGSLPQASASIE